jgi:tRNA pseudouridine13 synthase
MKIKCQPEDFRVEELPLVWPDGSGRYTLYRLTKRGVGTIEAIETICHRWNIPGRRVSYAGLKDRHAVTTQYVSIVDGPARTLSAPNFEVEPVGRLPKPYGPQQLRGNRFELVLRDLTEEEVGRIITAIPAIPNDGLPNYFDDQRFGSVGSSGEFIAQAWLAGDFERALKLALADPNPFDRAGLKAQKATLRAHWGRWAEAKAGLPRSSARSIVTYLVDHPTDWRGAFARLRRELRTLFFSAFQSHLWNLILARWLECSTRPEQLVPTALKVGTLPFPRWLQPEQVRSLTALQLPLPSSRSQLPEGKLGEIILEVLQPFGLAWSNLRVRYLKDVFFSKGSRGCLFFPESLEFASLKDHLHTSRHALRLSFGLAKGSYATILVKRLTSVADASQ